MRPDMLNLDISAESSDIISQQVLEEKFSAGLMEFEALLQTVSEEKKSMLVDLLEQFTGE